MNDDEKALHEDDEVESEFEEMDEEESETFLAEAIREFAEENDGPRTRTRTFGEAGVLTSNKGLVVRIGDAEFQVTIVRSR